MNSLSSIAQAAVAFAVALPAAAVAANAAAAGLDPAVAEFLVASAANDFKASPAGAPTAIRSARIGVLSESGTVNYLLCGYFKRGTGPKATWTDFATIKTSDYEQWLGNMAKAHCAQREIKWYTGDHSSKLLQKLKE